MPARRLVVALAVFLVGVLGVGVVTAINRTGEPAKPSAQPSPSSLPTETFTPPATTEPPLPTESPTAQETPTPTPTATGGSGGGGGGGGGNPTMPKTGPNPALALLAAGSVTFAIGLRRAVRR